jgi:hypothetical protein
LVLKERKNKLHGYRRKEGERHKDLSFVVLSSYTHSIHYIREIEKDKDKDKTDKKLVREKNV